MNDGAASPRALVADVFATLLVLGICVAGVSILDPSPLRTVLALVLVLTLPGYALSTLLFPARRGAVRTENDLSTAFVGRTDSGHAGLGGGRRVAVGIGSSLALVSLFGIAFDLFGIPFTVDFVTTATGGFTTVAIVTGGVRRYRTPEGSRYIVPLYRATDLTSWAQTGDQWTRMLDVVLAATVLLTTVSVGYAMVAPSERAAYTEASILTERNGELVADGYPDQMTVGEPTGLVVSVENHERERTTYSVVVQFQQVNDEGDVVKSTETNRFSKTVAASETWTARHEVAAPFAGDGLRIAYLVYRGSPPADPNVESSYRYLTLWTDVNDGVGGDGNDGDA